MENILDTNNIKKIVGIIAGAILFNWALQNINTIFYLLSFILKLFIPFIIGICIAFILNIPIRIFENKLHVIKNINLRRAVSLLLTIFIFFALVFLILFIVIPEISHTLDTLATMISGFINRISTWIQQISTEFPDLEVWVSKVNAGLELDWNKIKNSVFSFLQNGVSRILSSTFTIASSVFNSVFNFIVGFVFAIYILFQKENLARQIKKLLYAYLSERAAERIISISTLSNKTFSRFVTGQCTEAVILGLMFYISMLIFRFPYAITVAVLVVCTALIPVFGAFIACFIGTFLMLITNPVKALWFVLLFLVLQQVEGNFIYPRVVGSSVGLPAIWVMVAVTVGGNVAGIVGMLLCVPLCSVLYVLLKEEVGERLRKKQLSIN